MQCINAKCKEVIPNDVNYCAYCGARQLTWDIKMDERMMVAGLHSDDVDMFYSFFIVGYHMLHLQYQLKEVAITQREAQLLYARACHCLLYTSPSPRDS